MLKDALEFMAEIGRKSANRIVKPDAEPSHIYFVRQEDGTLERREADPTPAKHVACSLQAIVDIAKESATGPDDFAEVWYAPGQVVCTFGDHAMRNLVTLTVDYSDPMLVLMGWKKSASALGQAEIIRVLRTTFRDSLGRHVGLVDVLRKVNFRATAETEGTVGHGKASLGKQITGEVTGLGIIPEYIRFDLPVFANPCFSNIRATIECALEPDAGNGTFRVIPMPGQIETAQDSALALIGEDLESKLSGSDVKLYYGRP
jgi:hypothetical protein